MKRLLLHSCCAVCTAYPVEKLKTYGYLPIVYFFNPNIYPKAEYDQRLKELVDYCGKNGIECITEDYSEKDWYDRIKGLEDEPEQGKRCEKCFEFRLEKTAQKAKSMGINGMTTTLSVSPHKNSEKIFKIADKIVQKYDISFIKEDFKKNDGFKKTMQIAQENNFYRQNYCGCEFSRNFPT